MKNNRSLLTIQQAARRLDLSPADVENLVFASELRAVTVRRLSRKGSRLELRVLEADVDRLVKAQAEGASS